MLREVIIRWDGGPEVGRIRLGELDRVRLRTQKFWRCLSCREKVYLHGHLGKNRDGTKASCPGCGTVVILEEEG